ncbi:hypothetical protein GCM10010363_35330 [Streptomyces omiyaensis]|nr:hypothetical protein GCM10010363_35330 [Streptomyces omiyaensis]
MPRGGCGWASSSRPAALRSRGSAIRWGKSWSVAAEAGDRAPGGADRREFLVEALVLGGGVHDPPVDHGEEGLDAGDIGLGDGEVVVGEDGEVAEEAGAQHALDVLFAGEDGARPGEHREGGPAVDAVAGRPEDEVADGAAGDQPVQGDPRVVGGDAGGVGAAADGEAALQHGPQRRGVGGGARSVPAEEGAALEGEAVLHGDGAAERGDPVEAGGGDGLRVVEEPAVAGREEAVGREAFEDGEVAADGLVVGGVQAEAPAVLHEEADGPLELVLVAGGEFGPGLGEVLEVGGGPGEVLPRAVEPQPGVAVPGADGGDPAGEVGQFLPGGLREEVVGDAQGEPSRRGEPDDRGVVVGKALEASGGVDGRGEPEAVELPQEVACGERAFLLREGGRLGEGRVEDEGTGGREEHSGRFAVPAAHDPSAARVGGVAGESGGAHRGPVEDGGLVEVEDEDGGVGGGGVQLGHGGHPALGELLRRPAADDPHPLAPGRPRRLFAEHGEPFAEGGDAVPAQLQDVVEAAADDVQVGVVESGDDAAAQRVDHAGRRTDVPGDGAVVADGEDPSVADGERPGRRVGRIARVDLRVADDEVGRVFLGGAGHEPLDRHAGHLPEPSWEGDRASPDRPSSTGPSRRRCRSGRVPLTTRNVRRRPAGALAVGAPGAALPRTGVCAPGRACVRRRTSGGAPAA